LAGEGDASALAFFFDGLAEELAELELEVVFFLAGELEVEAVLLLVPDFFVVAELVPVVVVFLVVLAVLVLVCVSLCAHETMKAAATVRAMQGSKNFFICVFDQTVQTRSKSQAYFGKTSQGLHASILASSTQAPEPGLTIEAPWLLISFSMISSTQPDIP